MRDFLILFIHVIVTLARLAKPGGLRSVVAESVLVRHQLLVVLNRGRKRGPNLHAADRILAGLCTLFIRVRSQNFISHLNQWLAIQVCVPFRAALRRATNE